MDYRDKNKVCEVKGDYCIRDGNCDLCPLGGAENRMQESGMFTNALESNERPKRHEINPKEIRDEINEMIYGNILRQREISKSLVIQS